MVIGIDGRPVLAQNKVGISTYLNEILNHINDDIILFLHKKYNGEQLKPNITFRKKVYPLYRWDIERVWERFALPSMVNKSNSSLFWGPRFFVPDKLKIPGIATIHDLAFKKIPGIVSKEQIAYFDGFIQKSKINASHFITVSKATRDDLCEIYEIDEKKVSVIYNGYNQQFDQTLNLNIINQIKKNFSLPDNFILFLGTIEPRKNLERLIRAYEKSLAFKEGIPIVLSGKMGWLQNDLISKIQPLIEKKLIILTGYVNLVELKALYQSCLFFAFPSLYEGFGIPVIEAMASGAPVLTSGNSSLKELFSTSTHLVDPLSEESIVQGLNSMMDQDYRDKLRRSGYIIVKNFSWKKSAEEHKKLFENFS